MIERNIEIQSIIILLGLTSLILNLTFLIFFSEKASLTGLCGILGICNGPDERSRNLEEPYPSKSQSYPYSDIPFAESKVQSIVVAPPTKVDIGNI